jgi:hypothetical protein
MDGGQPFRFISFNLPNLQMIEDNLPFAGTNPWRLPDEFEIRDGLATVRQMGGTVVRTYVHFRDPHERPPARRATFSVRASSTKKLSANWTSP